MSSIIKQIRESIEEDKISDADRILHVGMILDNHARRMAGKVVIVSRHAGAIEWLREYGYVGPVIEQATADDVRNMFVIGNLPLHLAALTAMIGSIDLPNLPRELRGQDLTPEQMDAAGAVIRWYTVEAF